GRLLDVGCSIGLFLDLGRERGWDGVGIEFAPRALAYAREHYGLEVLDVPLEEAGLEPASLDAVGLLSVLEHTNEPRRMLAEEVPRRILAAIEPHLDELHLGYKLHALAVKRA